MQALKQELEKLFTPDFFPTTKDAMLKIAMQDASDQLLNFIYNLEDDENFKYNSIDDILPMPSLVEYPFYIEHGTSQYKAIAKDEYIEVNCKSDYWGSCVKVSKSEVVYKLIVNSGTRITREQFLEKYYEAQKEIRSLIFYDIKSVVV